MCIAEFNTEQKLSTAAGLPGLLKAVSLKYTPFLEGSEVTEFGYPQSDIVT